MTQIIYACRTHAVRTLCLVVFAALLGLTGPSFAQKGLTVDQIIAMHKAGVPAQIIEQNIKMTNAKYKLTVKDLRKLKKAKVPKKVVSLMKGKSSSAAPEPAKDDLERMKSAREFEKRRAEQEAEIRAAADAARARTMEAQEREEKQRIETALSEGKTALEAGDFSTAAKLFYVFINETDPNRPSVQDARLNLARAYQGLGLYANAVVEYLELLEGGPQSQTFREAFLGLREVAKISPVDSEKIYGLVDFPQDVDAPKSFQNSYNYFLGRFLFTKGELDRAEGFLSAVERDDVDGENAFEEGGVSSLEDYARAQYMIGLIAVENSQNASNKVPVLMVANKGFANAVSTAEEIDSEAMERVAQLSYLGLGRIFYTLAGLMPEDRRDLKQEFYDVAIYYYRKVPYASTNYVNAMFEAGWSYYFRGDYRRGLGFFHALDGPEWKDHFMPGVYLAEADVYVSKCHVDSAQEALTRFNKKFLPVRPAVTAYLDANPDPGALYDAFVRGRSNGGLKLPDSARMVVLTDPEFYEAFTEVDRLRIEAQAIASSEGDLGAQLTRDLERRLEGITEQKTIYLGVIIQNILQRKVVDEIEIFENKRQDLEDDIYQAKSVATDEQIKAMAQGRDVDDTAAEQQAASMFVGGQYVRWPFEGSFWEDEVKSYRSNLEDRCQ